MHLWQHVEPWFKEELAEEAIRLRDELGIIPSHGVRLTNLEPAEVDRAWWLIADRVDLDAGIAEPELRRQHRPPTPSVRWWDAMRSELQWMSEGAFAAASRQLMPLLFEVEAITVANQRLPTLDVEIWAEGGRPPDRKMKLFWRRGRAPEGNTIKLFWRINDPGWQPQTVAALAVLIGELRSLSPTSSMRGPRGNPEAFLRAVDAYLASRGDEAGQPHDS